MEPSTSFNRAIISDILLWIALVILLGAGVWFFAVKLPERRGDTITVHFQDANEITRGAIVRIMGTEIGYVDDIKLKQDHVDVTIKTNPGAIPVPSGSTFTVQFTGLVGSKSIEIVPPDIPRPTIQGTPLFLVEEPIRLKDMQNYQIDILQDLQHGAENIADFFGKKKSVEELQLNIYDYHIRTWDTVVFMDEVQQKIVQLDGELNSSIAKTAETLDQFTGSTRTAVASTHPAKLEANFNNVLGFFKRLNSILLAEGKTVQSTSRIQERLSRLNLMSARLGNRMKNMQAHLAGFPIVDFLGLLNGKQEKVLTFINRADAFTSKDYLPTLKKVRAGIQTFNGQLNNWHATVDKMRTDQLIQPPNLQEGLPNTAVPVDFLEPAPDITHLTSDPTSRSLAVPATQSSTHRPEDTAPPQQKSIEPQPKKWYYIFGGLSGCSSNK